MLWMFTFLGLVSLVFCQGIDSPPRFKQTIIPRRVALVKDSHKFQCRVKGSPKPYISWYYKNEPLSQNERIKITKYSLQISDLKISESGNYACKASNPLGNIWGNFSLQVLQYEGPPEFSKRLNLVSYLSRVATTSVEFDCETRAYPVASITWWKNGEQIKEEEGKYILDGYKLKVDSLTQEDRGNYTCVIKNEFGSLNWTTKLEVHQRVAIAPTMEDVENQTAIAGEDVTFTCQIVISDSPPLLQWLRHFQKNGSFVNGNGEPYVQVLQQSGFETKLRDPQHLVLHNVTKNDQGWYTCLVANTVGMNYRSAWLAVLNETETLLKQEPDIKDHTPTPVNLEERLKEVTYDLVTFIQKSKETNEKLQSVTRELMLMKQDNSRLSQERDAEQTLVKELRNSLNKCKTG